MRNVVELSSNPQLAAAQRRLASDGMIKLIPEPGAGSKVSRRKFSTPTAASIGVLGDRQIRAICSTGEIDRAGDQIEQSGISWREYLMNPVVLLNHDISKPIARTTQIGIEDGNLTATFEFPPPGTSAIADEALGLIKANVLSAISVGFDPIETEPMNAMNPRGPQRYKRITLLECSVVAVPCNAHALVVQRAKGYSRSATRSSKIPPVLDMLQHKANAAASISSAHACAASRELSVGRCLAVSAMSYRPTERRMTRQDVMALYERLRQESL